MERPEQHDTDQSIERMSMTDRFGPQHVEAWRRDGGVSIQNFFTPEEVAAVVADRVAAGDYAVDAAALNEANQARLDEVSPAEPGTPTVYDLKTNRIVDIQDPGWLDALSS